MSLAKALAGKSSSIILRYPTYDDSEEYVALRLLTALEDLNAFKQARKTAAEFGLDAPKESDPEYNLALQAEILYLCTEETVNKGTKEAPSYESTGKRVFDSSKEILHNLDQDRLHLLYQAYQTFRTACGKQIGTITPETLAKYLDVMGGEGGDKETIPFYSEFKPGLQFRLARITASLVRSALTSNSGGGLSSTPEPGPTTQDG